MRAAVVLENVARSFGGVQALRGISATLQPGQLTGIAGPDGAGKTTLMRLMAGLLPPDSGRITIAGRDTVGDAERLADDVGYMPQRFGLYEDLSVGENLRLYARLAGNAQPARQTAQLRELLEFTRLAPFVDRLAGRLSGGMKQKLGLACALMAHPKVLLLDEPGVGVDPLSRRELWAMVARLTASGMAVLWATAYLDEAERCDAVLLLHDGQLVYDGPPASLTARLAQRSLCLTPRGRWRRDRRAVLASALALPEVCDGTLQGDALRVVLKTGQAQQVLADFAAAEALRIQPVAPRFEDAFIDLLSARTGVQVSGVSPLAEKMAAIVATAVAPVACTHLSKRFGGFTAAEEVGFEVRPGEIFGLIGPNGAGKSTTFRMLCGLLAPTSGSARVMGLDLRHAPGAAKRQLGYMAQKFSLYGLLSVRQNLQFFAGIYGLEGRLRQARIDEMVDTFALAPYLERPPEELPLGFKQRLALACALMHRPPVLFLDEPTSGVDPLTRREFWTHINGLALKGVSVLVTTHFMDEAEYCDRVALMHRARLIAIDTPDALKAAVRGKDNADEPTMEEAFVALIREREA